MQQILTGLALLLRLGSQEPSLEERAVHSEPQTTVDCNDYLRTAFDTYAKDDFEKAFGCYSITLKPDVNKVLGHRLAAIGLSEVSPQQLPVLSLVLEEDANYINALTQKQLQDRYANMITSERAVSILRMSATDQLAAQVAYQMGGPDMDLDRDLSTQPLTTEEKSIRGREGKALLDGKIGYCPGLSSVLVPKEEVPKFQEYAHRFLQFMEERK